METKKILIVDDEPDIAKMVSMCLKSYRYATDTASDGEQALEKVSAFLPDLILLDLNMPKLDGAGFCKKLSLNPDSRLRDTPIVIMTALISLKKDELTLVTEKYPVLIKPFQEKDLLNSIGMTVRKD